MRVLHVGWGFWPWRPGGLIHYAEDLMASQVTRGHEIGYFFSGRHYPYVAGPRLKRWQRDGVAMFEVINPAVVPGMEEGTRDPERELSEPGIEAAFARTLRAHSPDVVHIQELHALPSSIVDVAAAAGVPTLMTLQDYFPLCATLRLVDADGRICTRRDVGADCVARNAAAPRGATPNITRTLQFELARLRQRLRLVPPIGAWLARLSGRVAPRSGSPAPPPPNPELERAFQRRRDVNVERLGRVDRLVAQSPRVAEVYRERGVTGERMTTLPFTLGHIERLRPRRLSSPPARITFATLNGCASPTKGSDVVVEALLALRAAGLEGRFRLRVLGFVHRRARPELERYHGVELHGLYEREQLDELLDDVDVGLMPSVWEEAFGYTGVELIAKGIPLIANPLGGIVEYAREGETAWLNRPCSGAGLAEAMSRLIAEPERVLEMHTRVLVARSELVVPMARHVAAIEDIYDELVDERSPQRTS